MRWPFRYSSALKKQSELQRQQQFDFSLKSDNDDDQELENKPSTSSPVKMIVPKAKVTRAEPSPNSLFQKHTVWFSSGNSSRKRTRVSNEQSVQQKQQSQLPSPKRTRLTRQELQKDHLFVDRDTIIIEPGQQQQQHHHHHQSQHEENHCNNNQQRFEEELVIEAPNIQVVVNNKNSQQQQVAPQGQKTGFLIDNLGFDL